MFIDRQQELAFLNNLLSRQHPGPAQMILVYGRRRIGKTSLLRHWAAQTDIPATFWSAEKEPASLQRRKLYASLLGMPISRAPIFESWADVWDAAASVIGQQKRILILDELPYAADSDPAMLSATSIGTKYPIAELMIAKGIKGVFNSAYSYTKISLTVKDFMKISPYGTLRYKVYGGFVNSTLPFTNLENHPGNDLYYYSPSSFNLMNRFEYLSDKYAGVNLEHNLGSGLFRFIPLTRKLKWRQFWNVKTLWGSLSTENNTINYLVDTAGNKVPAFKNLNGRTYIEVGTGIDNIFKVLRLDFVWRVSPTPIYAGKKNQFGIFGSFQFQF